MINSSLLVEIRIERAAGETGGSRDGLDAGGIDALFLEHARRRLEQFVAGLVPVGLVRILTSAHFRAECNSIQ